MLVADATSARFLHREPGGELEERWQLHSPDDQGRSLDPAPAERQGAARPPSPASVDYATRAFSAQIVGRLHSACDSDVAASLVVIAPLRFGGRLREDCGAALWNHVTRWIQSDGTRSMSADTVARLVDAHRGS